MTAPIAGTRSPALRDDPLMAARDTLFTRILERCGTKQENIAHLLNADSVLDSLPIQIEDIGAAIAAWRQAGGDSASITLPLDLPSEIDHLFWQVLGMRSAIKQAAEIVPAVTQDDLGRHLISICATPFMLRIEPASNDNPVASVSIETILTPDEGDAPAEQVSLLRTNHAMLQFWLTTLIVNWHGVRLHNALRDALNSEGPGVLRIDNSNPVPLMTRSDATALYWRILADNPSAAEIADLRSQLAETVDSMKKISQWPWPIVGKEAQSLGDIRRFAREKTPSPANDATPKA